MALNWLLSQQVPTTTGNFTISLPSNFDPKAIICWQGSYNGVGNDWNPCVGIGTYRGSTAVQRCWNSRSKDAATAADVANNNSTTAVMTQMTQSAGSSAIDFSVALVSMQTGATSNVILNCTDLASTGSGGADFFVLVLGGSDITDALVGTHTLSTSATNQDVTVVAGFGKPDFVFCGSAQDGTGTSASTVQWITGFGCQGEAGSSTSFTMTDGNTASLVTSGQRTNRIWQKITPNSTTYESIAQLDTTVSNWPTDGFRLVFDANPGFAAAMFYLALKGTFQKSSFSNTAPTAGGTPVDQDNNVGFAPAGFWVQGWNLVANTVANTTATDLGAWTHGVYDAGIASGSPNEGSSQWVEDDALGTMDSNNFSTNVKAIRYYTPASGGTLQSEADGAVSGNNVRLSWNDIDTVARQHIGFAFGDAPAAGTPRQVYKQHVPMQLLAR
jgi:hypothetical protein